MATTQTMAVLALGLLAAGLGLAQPMPAQSKSLVGLPSVALSRPSIAQGKPGATLGTLLGSERRRLLQKLEAGSSIAEVTVRPEDGSLLLLRLDHAPVGTKVGREALARAFLAVYQPLIDPRIDPRDYTAVPTEHGCDTAAVTFERRVSGLPVLGSHLTVRFSDRNHIVAVENGVASVPRTVKGALKPGAGLPPHLPPKSDSRSMVRRAVLVPVIQGSVRYLQRGFEVLLNEKPGRENTMVWVTAGTASAGPFRLVPLRPEGHDAPLHHIDPVSNLPDYISYHPVGGVPVSKLPAESSPGELVYRFLDTHPSLFRSGAPRCQFAIKRIDSSPLLPRTTFVRMAQIYAGLPVFGAELVFELRDIERVMAVTGHALDFINLDPKPRLSAVEAAEHARTHLSRALAAEAPSDLAAATVTAVNARTPRVTLGVLPGELARAGDKLPTALTYRVELGEYDYYIDARDGAALYSVSTHPSFAVNDAALQNEFKRPLYYPVNNNGVNLPTPPVAGVPNADVPTVVAALPVLRNGYAALGWRELDGHGLRTFVANTFVVMAGNQCPVATAFFDGDLTKEAFFCQGTANADLVGHEFTHGVVKYSSDLVYQDQPGALNEAYADIMGNLLFPDVAVGGAPPGWQVGESLPGGSLRNMAAPNVATMGAYRARNSAAATCGTSACGLLASSCDNGCVHTNSGIINLAHVLLSDGVPGPAAVAGGAVAVTNGIGRPRLATLAFLTMTQRLTPWSSLLDSALGTHANCESLRQVGGAGTDLTSSGGPPTPIGRAHCDEVAVAFEQVGLSPDLVSGWAEPELGFFGTDPYFTNGETMANGCAITQVFADLQTPSGDPRTTLALPAQGAGFLGLYGIAVPPTPNPIGTLGKRADIDWFSAWGRKPSYTGPGYVTVAPPAGQATCNTPVGSIPVQRVSASIYHGGNGQGLLGDKGDETIGTGASTMAAGCLLTDTRVELVGGDSDDHGYAGPANEAKDSVWISTSPFGSGFNVERGARIVTPPSGPPNLSAAMHWWYDATTDVRYRLRYYISQPSGTSCEP